MTNLEEFPFEITWALQEDYKPAMLMAWNSFMRFDAPDYDKEGVKSFFEFVSDDDVHKAFLAGQYKILVAKDGERIVGIASLRSGNRLSLLFVDEAYQGQRIGSVLVELMCFHLKQKTYEDRLLVYASPYAVEFYKKCGFRVTAPEEKLKGIRYTPMERTL